MLLGGGDDWISHRGRRVNPFLISCYANLVTGLFPFPNKEKKKVKKERKKERKEKAKGRKEGN